MGEAGKLKKKTRRKEKKKKKGVEICTRDLCIHTCIYIYEEIECPHLKPGPLFERKFPVFPQPNSRQHTGMSLNFTGKPKRRNINLGNRSLSGHDRKSFLESARRDREERAQRRRKISAATMIQAAVRAMEDLHHKRGELGEQWAGRLEEFCFFYPYVVVRQEAEVSRHQLEVLQGQLRCALPEKTLESVVRALVDADKRLVAFCGGAGAENPADYTELVTMSIPVIRTAIEAIGTQADVTADVARLLGVLFDLFHVEKQLENDPRQVLSWIFEFSSAGFYRHKATLHTLLSQYRYVDVVDAMLDLGFEERQLVQFIDALVSDVLESKTIELRWRPKIVFLCNVCRLYQLELERTGATMSKRDLEFFSTVFPQCHVQGKPLYFASQFTAGQNLPSTFKDEDQAAIEMDPNDAETGTEDGEDGTLSEKCKFVIPQSLEKGLLNFYETDCAVRAALKYSADAPALCATFIYELLQLVAPQGTSRGSANAKMESSLLYLLISSSGVQTVRDPAVFMGKDPDSEGQIFMKNYSFESISRTPEITRYFDILRNPALISWWRTMYVVLMMYSRIVSSLSNSAMTDTMGDSAFSSLLFLFKDIAVKTVLYAHQYLQSAHGVRFDVSFQQVVLAALDLLRLVYRRNLRVKMLPDEYWTLGDFKASGILPLLGAIAQMHGAVEGRDNFDAGGSLRRPGAGNPTLELMRGEPLFTDGESSKFLRHIFAFDGDYNGNESENGDDVVRGSAGAMRILPSGQYQALSVFSYIPYMVPFAQRADVFHRLIKMDRARFVQDTNMARSRGTISRDNVLFDAFDQFYSMSGTAFKNPLAVQFVNSFGEVEAGIDGGGLTKELLTSIVNTVFIPSAENIGRNKGYRFFDATSDHQLYPSADFYLQKRYMEQNPGQTVVSEESIGLMKRVYRFIGMVVGKCLYDNVLIDVSFAPFFLNMLMCSETCAAFTGAADTGRESFRNSYDDLQLFDPELYGNLEKLLRFSPDDVASLGLTFSVTEQFEYRGQQYTLNVDLDGKDGNGAEKQVTAQNKLQYVLALARYKLNTRIKEQALAFMDGLCQVIDEYWLTLFSPYELQTLISGGDKGIDVNDLRANVVYGGYTASSNTVQLLFEVLKEFSAEEKAKFIKFVTSSSRQPLLGFKELSPKFGIRNAGDDLSRLPTASTCVNLLKLPDYNDKDLLRKKLLCSINAQAGFDLS